MSFQETVKSYEAEGYQCSTFSLLSYPCVVVMPKHTFAGAPWVWRMEFFGCFDWVDRALLEKGWHVVYAQMSDWYGAPRIIDTMERFYTKVQADFQLSKRADVFGFSRGGLYAFNYAVRNPDKIATLYLDAPVIDLASWPGGFYQTAPHYEREWLEACQAYEMSSEELVSYKNGLEKKFAALIEHRVKLLLVAGLKDTDVPYSENGALLEQYYHKNKGDRKVVIKPETGHHPHSLEQPEELLEYIMDNFIHLAE